MASTPQTASRNRIAGVAIVIWVLVLLFGWALRPIDDTVPVDVDPTSELAAILVGDPAATPVDAPRAQPVECNSLFASTARDADTPLPVLRADYVYSREPCVGPHHAARWTLAVNVAALVAGLSAWFVIARRQRTPAPGQVDPVTTTA